jgi:hypothetical protein
MMKHKETQEFYNLSISQDNVDKNPTLRLIYGSTESLFLDIKGNFKQVVIDDNGVITL